MWSNNLLSIVFHILVLVITALLFSIGNYPILFLFVVLVAFFLYIALGNIILDSMGSTIRNLFSVSSVSLIGLVIGGYCFIFPGKMGFHWMVFLLYNLDLFGMSQAFQFEPSPLNTFWFSLFPSLSLWIGLQLKALGYKFLK
jgi:hypothetical protein